MLTEIIIGVIAFILIFCIGFKFGVDYMKDNLSNYDLYPKFQDLSESELHGI